MKRRDFIQLSSLSLAALMVEGCEPIQSFDVEFKNDMPFGHLVFESQSFPSTRNLRSKYLIVGGGIAGLSAAYQLKNEDFLVFEVSNMLGGTSAGSRYRNASLCHGAHYDLEYPPEYGAETLKMLDELDIIRLDKFSGSWKFVDKQYLIPKNKESRTFAHKAFRKDVLPDGELKIAFVDLLKSFSGKMPMPSRLINEEFRSLEGITFLNWLQQKLELTADFIAGLDYHMKDDYGAGADQVSALAGIHYFACRPYYTKPVELFSPPEGNSYFINRIVEQLPSDQIYTSHVVKQISEKASGFDVEVIDAINKEIVKVSCEKIIYAGNKHALKFIYPKDFQAFEKNEYAPWVVVNIVLNNDWGGGVFWQNEILSEDTSLMGFVDSKAQNSTDSDLRILTVYYCFKPEEREMMSLIADRKKIFVEQTIKHLEAYFNRSLKNKIEKVFIKQMGHAMPIPKPGYLFHDANLNRSNPNLIYAGVDNGRLPLLFEAMDSGILAVNQLAN